MKLNNSSPVSLLSLGEDKYIMHLRDRSFTLNGQLYNGLSIIFRLLTYNEIKLLDRLLPDASDARENAASITADLEEDIFSKCVFHIFGFDTETEIDLDYLEAGIISTVSGLIQKRSYEHVNNPPAAVAMYAGSIGIIDQIRLVVARVYSTPISEVDNLPLDVLYKRFATFQATYPNEALRFNDPEESQGSDE